MSEAPQSRLRRIAREPLLHFLILGAILFAGIAAAREARRPVVRIGAAEIEQLAAFWELQSQRPPTRQELASLIQERVDEELLSREALRLGLDKDDMIIRRRLAQKMSFASDDTAAIPEPDDKTLEAFYAKHRADYARPGHVALRHVFFSHDRTGVTPAVAANAALPKLRAGDAVMGDPSMLALAYADITDDDIVRNFGDDFAAAVRAAPIGTWSGPAPSAFGVHLIRVERRTPGEIPPLSQVRDEVRQAWLAEKRQESNRAFRLKLRDRYKVEIADLPK